jgi:hypothetical protein
MDELDDSSDPLDLLGAITSTQDNSQGDLNGSSAPNSSPITGLSTPVDTSGGNTNTSGTTLSSFLSGLSGLGSSAANAYATVVGKAPAKASTTSTGTAATFLGIPSAYLPWVLIGAGVLAVVLFLTHDKK